LDVTSHTTGRCVPDCGYLAESKIDIGVPTLPYQGTPKASLYPYTVGSE
jgi:hypothetical protein